MIKRYYKGRNLQALAQAMKIARSSLYYQRKNPREESNTVEDIKSVLKEYPYYGHRRIALALKVNKKRVRRLMRKYDLTVRRKKTQRRYMLNDIEIQEHTPNLTKELKVVEANQVWATDYTFLKLRKKYIFLSTVIDIFTRQIKGWYLTPTRGTRLVIEPIRQALKLNSPPEIIHSDQGTEYTSHIWSKMLTEAGIKVSMSAKSSPWENGFQESFYSRFKEEFEPYDSSENLQSLYEKLYWWIDNYNTRRIHSALRMPPSVFAKKCHIVSKRRGT